MITTRHVRFDETFGGRLSEEGINLQQPVRQQSTQPPTIAQRNTYESDSDEEDPIPISGGEPTGTKENHPK